MANQALLRSAFGQGADPPPPASDFWQFSQYLGTSRQFIVDIHSPVVIHSQRLYSPRHASELLTGYFPSPARYSCYYTYYDRSSRQITEPLPIVDNFPYTDGDTSVYPFIPFRIGLRDFRGSFLPSMLEMLTFSLHLDPTITRFSPFECFAPDQYHFLSDPSRFSPTTPALEIELFAPGFTVSASLLESRIFTPFRRTLLDPQGMEHKAQILDLSTGTFNMTLPHPQTVNNADAFLSALSALNRIRLTFS